MISQMLMIFTLLTIWISLAWGLVILFSAVHFWFKHSDFRVDTSPLPYYPKVTIIVPAHNCTYRMQTWAAALHQSPGQDRS